MTKSKPTPQIKEKLPADKVAKALDDLTASIMAKFPPEDGSPILVGIQTRGAIMAKRIAEKIKSKSGIELPVGQLDITLYRDDFSTRGTQPIVGETHLDFPIDDKPIVLIDDVLFTGRTIRAALDQLMDFGRPNSITLAVLIDRGHRELPIASDFAPIVLPTKREESVNLRLKETDGRDEIVICEPVNE